MVRASPRPGHGDAPPHCHASRKPSASCPRRASRATDRLARGAALPFNLRRSCPAAACAPAALRAAACCAAPLRRVCLAAVSAPAHCARRPAAPPLAAAPTVHGLSALRAAGAAAARAPAAAAQVFPAPPGPAQARSRAATAPARGGGAARPTPAWRCRCPPPPPAGGSPGGDAPIASAASGACTLLARVCNCLPPRAKQLPDIIYFNAMPRGMT